MCKKIQEKQPSLINQNEILFHQQCKTAFFEHHTKKLFELGWELLSHPAYYPDIAPDIPIIICFILCKTFSRKKFKSEKAVRKRLISVFDNKSIL